MPRNRDSIPLGVGLVLAVVLTQSFGGMAKPQDQPDASSSQQRHWKAVYQAGAAPFSPGSRMLVTMTDNSLVCKGKKSRPFFIPAHSITAVSSNLTSEHTATRNQVQAWSGLAQFSPYTLLFLPFGLPVMAATYPVKSKYAYISILWSDEATDEEVRLRLDRKDYKPFLEELQKASGREWKNLDTEWEKVQQTLVGGTNHKMAIRLDRIVRLEKVDLKPGFYQLVLLTQEAGRGEAYLFPNNEINIEHLAATAMVDILPLSSDTQAATVIYKEDVKGESRISEIRYAGQVLRFR